MFEIITFPINIICSIWVVLSIGVLIMIAHEKRYYKTPQGRVELARLEFQGKLKPLPDYKIYLTSSFLCSIWIIFSMMYCLQHRVH